MCYSATPIMHSNSRDDFKNIYDRIMKKNLKIVIDTVASNMIKFLTSVKIVTY